MQQAFYGTVMCSIEIVVVSLMTPPPPKEKLEGLTGEYPFQVISHAWTKEGVDPRTIAMWLIGVMVVLYYFFQ
jgi:hypothetical protein